MKSIPRPVVRVAELMSTFRPWWALCGGWAVDAWIGEQTRDHVDIDMATLPDDQRAVFEQLSGWNLIAHDAIVDQETTEPWEAGVSSCRRTCARTRTTMSTSRRSATGTSAISARGYETRSGASIPPTRGWTGRRTRTRTRTSFRPRSGYRDRRARPSDPAGGA